MWSMHPKSTVPKAIIHPLLSALGSGGSLLQVPTQYRPSQPANTACVVSEVSPRASACVAHAVSTCAITTYAARVHLAQVAPRARLQAGIRQPEGLGCVRRIAQHPAQLTLLHGLAASNQGQELPPPPPDADSHSHGCLQQTAVPTDMRSCRGPKTLDAAAG